MVSVNIALSYLYLALVSIVTVHVNNMDSVSKEVNSGWRQASSSRTPLPTHNTNQQMIYEENLKSQANKDQCPLRGQISQSSGMML